MTTARYSDSNNYYNANNYWNGYWIQLQGEWRYSKPYWKKLYLHKKNEWVWIEGCWWYDKPRWVWVEC